MQSSKFTEIDEEFVCENCGQKVDKLGYSCRNHCPHCLHSKHLDINPGDRQEQCHGIMEPISVELSSKKGYVIIFKCKKCGAIRKNKAATDDNTDLLIELTAKSGQLGRRILTVFGQNPPSQLTTFFSVTLKPAQAYDNVKT